MAGVASPHSVIILNGGDQKNTLALHSQEPQSFSNKRRRFRSSVIPRLPPRCCSKTASLYDLHNYQIPYKEAWAWQKGLVEEVASSGTEAGAAILLQHPPVYTLGAGSTEDHLRFDPAAPPLPLYRTERGGEVTYHGPGQLVLYPILNLRHFRQDLHWYLRSLEEVVIRALGEVSGLQGERVPGLTGVWVDGQKVAAIGVRATRWVTYHGLALNVTTDLAPFKSIVPCGIADKPVASVAGLLLQQAVAEDPFAGEERLREAAAVERDEQRLVEEYRWGLVAAAEEVLGIEWEVVSGGEALERLNARRGAERGLFKVE